MARRVVVTGGASGIGRVMAEAFLALGDQVAVCDSSEANIQDMQRAHPKCIAHCADVRNEAEMSAFFAQLEDAYGGVDVLISNAGTGGPAGGHRNFDLCGLERLRFCKPRRRISELPVGGSADEGTKFWSDHPYFINIRTVRCALPQPLCGSKMGAYRVDENAGD